MKTVGFFVLLMVLASSQAFAQARDAVEVKRSIIQTERKMIVSANMPLSEEESAAFWPVYNEFQDTMRKLNDRRTNLILDLISEFDDLSGERAQDMVKEALSIEEKRIKLQRKFLGKFNKVLPPKKVARFFQIENRLNARISDELLSRMPLIDPDVAAPPE